MSENRSGDYRPSRRELLKGIAMLIGAPELLATAASAKDDPRNTRGVVGGEDLLRYVNVMQGTNSNFGFSRGNTLPIISLPFGMTNWTPQTDPGRGWFFDPNQHKIQGIRATHQPSPWMGDYGHFTVMAQSGAPVYGAAERVSEYDPRGLTVRPDYFSVDLKRDGVKIEAAPTERCAIFRFTFPAGVAGRVIVDAHSHVEIDRANGVLTGYSKLKGGAPDNFACYFYARFDRPIAKAYPLEAGHPMENASTADGKDIGAALEFETESTVVMRIASSFISVEQARINLDREIGSKTLEAVRTAGARVWNETLGCIRVSGGAERDKRTFYSCLYRAHLFPRMFHEHDAAGKTVHYSAFDGKVHDGVMYTDTGLWDGYHTLYPLLSLIQPQRLGEIVEGFLNAYREGGWLPQWPNPGYRGTMGGTHSDVVVGDAIVKRIAGFDRETAYAAIRKDGMVPPTGTTEGRGHLKDYLALGYVPGEVSESLDYAYDDACIALAARQLGKTDDDTTFSRRALNYRNVYDSTVGFMRPKTKEGGWRGTFDQYAWGNGYTEGGPWQWSLSVPHDPAGLMTLLGGRTGLLRKLDRMLWQAPTFHPGGYGGAIHEMLEMAAIPFGQYAQSNQPVHQVLALYAAAGSPAKLHYWSRRVLQEAYSPDNFPGDEDNGEMAAWFVLAALGLFPGCPGHPSFVLGSPLFEDIRIKLPQGKTLRLRAPGNSPSHVYANMVERNGHRHEKLWIDYADVMKGGELRFAMSDRPSERALSVDDLPFSFSAYAGDFSRTVIETRIAINCGGADTADFIADYYHDAGVAVKIEDTPTPPATGSPTDLYGVARQGVFTYKIPLPMLPEGRSYTVRLHTLGEAGGLSVNGKALPAVNTHRGNPILVATVSPVMPDDRGAIVIESRAEGSKLCAIEVFV